MGLPLQLYEFPISGDDMYRVLIVISNFSFGKVPELSLLSFGEKSLNELGCTFWSLYTIATA